MICRIRNTLCAGVLCAGSFFVSDVSATETADLLKVITAVAPEGSGNRAAQKALDQLVASGSVQLTEVLTAFDDAGPLAANWLRGAFETLADRRLKETGKLPAGELEAFIRTTSHNPRARRLAYEWLLQVDATAETRLIPGMLHDRSVEFRRDAVQLHLEKAAQFLKDGRDKQATEVFLAALDGARDDDQIKDIVAALGKLGQEVNLPRHFGFVMNWQLIGPFDNSGKQGFDIAYPPEDKVDFATAHKGKMSEVSWATHTTDHDYGIVDLAKARAPHKGAIIYAANEYYSERKHSVELRLGTPNAWKVWVNGKLVFGRPEYHRGMKLDQYQMRAVLRRGKNVILVKVCQNEQDDSWAQRWQFQLRVCDASGTAILAANRPAEILRKRQPSEKGAE